MKSTNLLREFREAFAKPFESKEEEERFNKGLERVRAAAKAQGFNAGVRRSLRMSVQELPAGGSRALPNRFKFVEVVPGGSTDTPPAQAANEEHREIPPSVDVDLGDGRDVRGKPRQP